MITLGKLMKDWPDKTRFGVIRRVAVPSVLAGMLISGGESIASDASMACLEREFDPIAEYGDRIYFDVRRNGKVVGHHEVNFSRDGEKLQVRSSFDLEINFLIFNAYSYRYESKSTWNKGCLLELHAKTNENGDETRVVAQREGEMLIVDGPSGRLDADFGILPTDHWHPDVLGATRVLNTIKGTVDDVEIIDEGIEEILTAAGPLVAKHYRYTGDLKNNVWYDSSRRWVKMRFEAEDGSIIDYVCKTCNASANQGS